MSVQSSKQSTLEGLNRPLYALGGSAILIAVLSFLRVVFSWQGETELSWMVILLPWLAIGIAALVALAVKPSLKLALTAGATTLAAYLGLQNFTLHLSSGNRWGYVMNEYNRDSEGLPLSLTSVFEVVALIGLMIATVWVIVALKSLLLGPASRASFGVDTTLLITAFALLAMNPLREEGWWPFDFIPFQQVILLSWVVPCVVVLALFVRQGGALAIGATTGLLTGTVLLPRIGERISDIADDDLGILNLMLPELEYSANIPLALLLMVTIWWSLSRNAGGNPDLVTAKASSPINGTSIVAFSLAWLPLTSVPAVVLGHMAYDQIVDGEIEQRGLGLARWSIVVAYLSLFGGGFFIFNQLM